MPSPIQTLTRHSTRNEEPLNILTFPTHEPYATNMARTDHRFWLWQAEGLRTWNEKLYKVPDNHHILNIERGDQQLPTHVDIDLILSQQKFGQFQISHQISQQLGCPIVSLEHTLPAPYWNRGDFHKLMSMRGNKNIFISHYSRGQWGFDENEARVIHHGIDVDRFKPADVEREAVVVSAVNDWINRDIFCGFYAWKDITGWPESKLPLKVFGDTPGLSEAIKPDDLIKEFQKSRIFLNTSLISPIPTTLLESMACGCAIVTSGTCMIPTIIENGVNGFISNEIIELRQYLDVLLNNEKLAKQMGEAARQTIIEKFSMDRFVDEWNEVFMDVIK